MPALCGIAYPDSFQTDPLVDTMLHTMKHRNNDQKDFYRYKSLKLGISGGSFRSNEQQTIWVSIDGSVYNADEVKKELKSSGQQVKESSTAKLIAQAYELWGLSFLPKLNGSFCICIFDQNTQQLTLIRDRMGKKPLYWAHHHQHFLFSSELKGILASGLIPQTPATDALSAYLFFGFIPQDMTAIKEVNKLLPGYYLQFNLDSKISVKPYWSLSSHFLNKTQDNFDTVLETLDYLICDAVKIRLPPKPNTTCLLDGGAGSAATTYYVKENSDANNIQCTTALFEGESPENSSYSQSLAQNLSLQFSQQCITPTHFLDSLIQVVWYLDEPLADPLSIATWKLYQQSYGNSLCVFSGLGSDELLGEHVRYTLKSAKTPFSWLELLPTSFMRHIVFPLAKKIHPHAAFDILRRFHSIPMKVEYLQQNAIFNESAIRSIAPSYASYFSPMIFLQKFYHLFELEQGLSSFQYFDLKTSLADNLLPLYERLASAHHLDCCTPFLDFRIIEYLVSLPSHLKFHEKSSAFLLKKLLRKKLPHEASYQDKQIYKSFLNTWTQQASFQNIFQSLSNGLLVESGIVSPKGLKQLLTNTQLGKNHFQQLWSLLILEVWFRLFIDSPVTTLSESPTLSSFPEHAYGP